MPAWEYCSVVGIRSSVYDRKLTPYYPAIWQFNLDGISVIEIKGDESKEVSRTIARLGQDGWEMVGCVHTSEFSHAIYFKRLKP